MPLIARPDDRTLVRVGRSTYKATVSHEVDAYWQQSARVQESRPDVQFRRFRCPRETELSVQQRPKYASVTPLLLKPNFSLQYKPRYMHACMHACCVGDVTDIVWKWGLDGGYKKPCEKSGARAWVRSLLPPLKSASMEPAFAAS